MFFDVLSKYAWIASWINKKKKKKNIAFANAFQKTLDESNRKPNRI